MGPLGVVLLAPHREHGEGLVAAGEPVMPEALLFYNVRKNRSIIPFCSGEYGVMYSWSSRSGAQRVPERGPVSVTVRAPQAWCAARHARPGSGSRLLPPSPRGEHSRRPGSAAALAGEVGVATGGSVGLHAVAAHVVAFEDGGVGVAGDRHGSSLAGP